MILYCYISHQKKILEDVAKIEKIMGSLDYDNYLIFYGGVEETLITNKVFKLNCDDTYEGLPNKIHTLYKFIINNNLLQNKFTHVCKIDGSTIIKSLFPYLPDIDYYGYTQSDHDPPDYRRMYHFGKCSENSHWNSKKYTGSFVTYCGGGVGYILSKKSLSIIADNPPDLNTEIYEDLYVGKTLNKFNINPKHIDMLKYIEKWR